MSSVVISYLPSQQSLNVPGTEGDLQVPGSRLSIEIEEKSFDAVKTECLSQKLLFEDPKFPAVDTSMYFSAPPPYVMEWLRPPDIAAKYGLLAEFFVSGSESGLFSIQQGELGSSAVVGALAMMSENPELLKKIIPRGQSFHANSYAGVFCFRFWRHEAWEEVVIDDRLPIAKEKGESVFVHSLLKRNEFWPALLEKAYAKLMGSYESLRSCTIVDVLHDFTGGLVESYCLERDPPHTTFLTDSVLKALERQSLVGCYINIQDVDGHPAAHLSNGLVTGQLYNITDIRELKLISDNNEVPIVFLRIKNPWGRKNGWKGPWNEKSTEWNNIAPCDRKSMGLLLRDDAEFWMELKDFLSNFDFIDICNLTPDDSNDIGSKLVSHTFSGRWKRGVTGGGRPSCKETHWLNPQYKLSLNQTDNDSNNICTIIVQLEQRCIRMVRYKLQNFVDIGFVIYKCSKENTLPLPNEFFQSQIFVARCDYFCNSRVLCKRFVLEPGTYVIIPCTYEADVEANFILQVLTEKENTVEYVDVSTTLPDNFSSLGNEHHLRDKEEMFQKYFNKYSGEDLRIDVHQFRQLLTSALKKEYVLSEFGLPVCKSLLLLVDKESCGKMKYVEYMYLWNLIKSWRRTFATFDKSNQGTVNAYELRSLVATLGYRISAPIASRLVFRYANEQYLVDLESFVACMAQVLNLYEIFKNREKNGKMVCTLEEWLEVSLNI